MGTNSPEAMRNVTSYSGSQSFTLMTSQSAGSPQLAHTQLHVPSSSPEAARFALLSFCRCVSIALTSCELNCFNDNKIKGGCRQKKLLSTVWLNYLTPEEVTEWGVAMHSYVLLRMLGVARLDVFFSKVNLYKELCCIDLCLEDLCW